MQVVEAAKVRQGEAPRPYQVPFQFAGPQAQSHEQYQEIQAQPREHPQEMPQSDLVAPPKGPW